MLATKIKEAMSSNTDKKFKQNPITVERNITPKKSSSMEDYKHLVQTWAKEARKIIGEKLVQRTDEKTQEVLQLALDYGLFIEPWIFRKRWVDVSDLEDMFFQKPRLHSAVKNGLIYTHAARAGSCNTIIYCAWESLFQVNYDEEGNASMEKGCWDSNGVWGAAPWMIDKAFFLSGCKMSDKFWVILKLLKRLGKTEKRYDFRVEFWLDKLRKSHSVNDIIAFTRGWNTCERVYNNRKIKTKVVIKLGKLSYPLRVFLIKEHKKRLINSGVEGWEESTTNVDTSFSFEPYKEWVKMSKLEKSMHLKAKDAWYFLYGRCPEFGENVYLPRPSQLARHKKGLAAFIRLTKEYGNTSDMMLPIFNICCLTGSYAEAIKFVGKGDIHDVGQFDTPTGSKDWKGFVFKYPKAVQYSSLFGYIEQTLGRIPTTLKECSNTAALYLYDGVNASNEEVAIICSKFSLDQDKFEQYSRVLDSVKTSESCPHVDITIGSYRLYKLRYNDPRGLFLGHYTNCCQHLGSAGAACALHGWSQSSSAFYVVEYKGEIVTQSWAWRSKESDLVFDSIEGLSGYDIDIISRLFLKASNMMLGKLGIERVMVGITSYGLTIALELNTNTERYSVSMKESCSYMDGSKQYLITETGNKPSKFKGKAHRTESPVINVLQEGSGVYCEHCEAEVHPTCEICPSCEENIAEWV
jgi:hypothetical protein